MHTDADKQKENKKMIKWLKSLFETKSVKKKRNRRDKLDEAKKIAIRALYANRKSNGHTQKSIAEAYGVSASTISKYINDSRRV